MSPLLHNPPIQRTALRPAIDHLRVRTCVAVLLALVAAGCGHTKDIEETKRYYEAIVPALDGWKDDHGVYPSSLGELGLDLPKPPIPPDEFTYSVGPDGTWFRFDVLDPGSFIYPQGWAYGSEGRKWYWYD